MATSTTLEIILQARDEATAKLKSLSAQAKEFSATAGVMGAAITGALALTVKSAAEAQEKMANVYATLQSMGKDTPAVRDAIQKAADATLKLGFDNEEAALSITKFYQRTKDMTTAVQLNNVAMDLARAKHIDLNSAMVLVNQVLSGNGKVLKQYGINIKDTASPLEALGELHTQVAGQAEAYANTFAGASEVFKQQTGELMEQIGAQLLPILVKIVQFITPIIQKVIDWMNAHQELSKIIVMVVAGLGVLLSLIGAIGLVIAPLTAAFAFFAGTGGLVVLAIAGIIAVVTELIAIYDLLFHHGDEVIAGIKIYWQEFKDFIKKSILDPIAQYFSDVWVGIKATVKEAADAIMSYFQPILNAIDKIKAGVGSAVSSVKGYVSSAYSEAKYLVTGKAGGGTVMANTPYIVGEKGAEVFTPSVTGTITPNGALAGGGSLVVNINGGTYLSESVAKEIGDMIMQQFRRQSRI